MHSDPDSLIEYPLSEGSQPDYDGSEWIGLFDESVDGEMVCVITDLHPIRRLFRAWFAQ